MEHKSYDVAAYIWPAYTGDEIKANIFWPEEYGEWESVRSAQPKFEGHQWPRKPRWGYVNEADPYVMEMQINAATDHGVNTFIYDWYWFDNGPFLEQCLDNGFLKAHNNDKMKFYIMWANHDVNHVWDKRNAHKPWADLWSGKVTADQFKVIVDRWIDQYLLHPSYYRIDNKPVVQIYYLPNFIMGLGGITEAQKSLDYMQNRAIQAGLPGIHVQTQHLRGREYSESKIDRSFIRTDSEMLDALKIDSTTHYQFATHCDVTRPFPEAVETAVKEWDYVRESTNIPFYPHVSIGWDNNPRFLTLQPNVMPECTPQNFEVALRKAKEYVDKYCDVPLITINSWNEWTEGSYLQPDDLNGYGYLEAVRNVFGPANK